MSATSCWPQSAPHLRRNLARRDGAVPSRNGAHSGFRHCIDCFYRERNYIDDRGILIVLYR
jgi:hypothetical protein